MKVIMIYDQIQSGAGIKDDHMIPLGAKKEPVGPAIMMEQYLKTVDGRVMACLYCGDGYYEANPEEVSRKLCAMVNKLKPDVVMCGPALEYYLIDPIFTNDENEFVTELRIPVKSI